MQETIQYEGLSSVLAQVGFVDETAAFHGALCGALCVKQSNEVDLVLLLDPAGDQSLTIDTPAQKALSEAREQTLISLQDNEGSFAPLLPHDDSDLPQRVAALVAWCEGFLFGLSTKPNLDLESCSVELQEIIEDFTQFTRASIDGEDNVELEETAYAELVEYIRVGAQLVYMEMRPRPTPDPQSSKKLH